MRVTPLPIEEKAKLLVLREKLLEANRELDKASAVAGLKRNVAMKLEEELVLQKRELAIKYGGNTNWVIDFDLENAVLDDRDQYSRRY